MVTSWCTSRVALGATDVVMAMATEAAVNAKAAEMVEEMVAVRVAVVVVAMEEATVEVIGGGEGSEDGVGEEGGQIARSRVARSD